MGLTIERERFDPADYQRFEQRLEECLVALGRLLERPAFGRGQATVGAELELSLVNDKGRALPRNQEVRAETADPRVVLEIDRFNLELNLTPAPLAGQAGGSRGSPLGPAGPGPGRWSCWRRASGCTSRYCRWSAPSSRLTASTRATGSRPSRSCGCTRGTVWRWSRAIYDPADGGHLRIEMQALPAGPTVTDMLANAAFLLGLTLALAPGAATTTRRFAFQQAQHNFYRAGQFGLGAELAWPLGPSGRPRTLPVPEPVRHLLPLARQGLEDAGVFADEAGQLLSVIAARAASGQTGATWQRLAMATLEPELGRRRALAAMLERYLELQRTGEPVHTWPLP